MREDGVSAPVRLMAAAIHVRGDFLAIEGRRAAIADMVRRLENGLARPFGAHLPILPRLAKARAAGLSTDPWHANQGGDGGVAVASTLDAVPVAGLR